MVRGKAGTAGETAELIVVENWLEEAKQAIKGR